MSQSSGVGSCWRAAGISGFDRERSGSRRLSSPVIPPEEVLMASSCPTFFREEPFGECVDGLSHFWDQRCAIEPEVQTGDLEDAAPCRDVGGDPEIVQTVRCTNSQRALRRRLRGVSSSSRVAKFRSVGADDQERSPASPSRSSARRCGPPRRTRWGNTCRTRASSLPDAGSHRSLSDRWRIACSSVVRY